VRHEDLWVRDGRVIDPRPRFWEAQSRNEFSAELIVDCGGAILSPGFLDIQINGGFGVDFSNAALRADEVALVCRRVLEAGVTSVCPTLVSSSRETYAPVLAVFREIRARHERLNAACVRAPADADAGGSQVAGAAAGAGAGAGAGCAVDGRDASFAAMMALEQGAGARILGMHLEGPFLNSKKKGAHSEENIRAALRLLELSTSAPTAALSNKAAETSGVNGRAASGAMAALREIYGEVEWDQGEVRIITIAPEVPGAMDAIAELRRLGVVASIGHSDANIRQADLALSKGATLITHLFNAMTEFGHREPGIIGLLGLNRNALRDSRKGEGQPQLPPVRGDVGATMTRALPDLPGDGARRADNSAAPRYSPSAAAKRLAAFEVVTPFSRTPFRDARFADRPPGSASASALGPSAGGSDDEGNNSDLELPHYMVEPALQRGAAAVAAIVVGQASALDDIIVASPELRPRVAGGGSDTPISAVAATAAIAYRGPRVGGGSAGGSDRSDTLTSPASPLTTPGILRIGPPAADSGRAAGDGINSGGGDWRAIVAGRAQSSPRARRQGAPLGGAENARVNMSGAVVATNYERPFFGLIVDGVHTHPFTVNIAYEAHHRGLILVTDAMAAMGLAPGRHHLGDLSVDVFPGRETGEGGGFFDGMHAVLANGSATLAGAVLPLDHCARKLAAFTGCPLEHVLAAVTTHPAEVLRLTGVVGGLEPGCWADITVIDDEINVLQTWVAGSLLWRRE
jgi:N-acetylglucosamine-6-phosphate deacetylase